MPLSAKERQQRWRDRKKSTQEGLAEYKRAEHERYEHRKQTGSRKLVKDMSAREHRMQLRKWRTWKANSIRRQPESQHQLQPVPEVQSSTITSNTDTKLRGRRKVRKDRAQAYRTIAKLKEQLQQKNKTIQRYRQRLYRKNICSRSNEENKNTPRSATRRQLAGCHVNSEVRKRLLFHNVVVAQLKSGFSRAKTEHQKRDLAQTVGGKLLKKYRLMSLAKTVGCSRRLLNSKGLGRMRRKSAVSDELMKHIRQFYLREDNSSSTAGKKETITRRKVKKQICILRDTCKNLHKKYLCENELNTVSYTTFLRLKPFWVISRPVDRRDTCLCKTCDNLQLKANVLLKSKVLNTARLEHLASAFCCSTDSVQCMFGLCSLCNSCKYPAHIDMFDLSTEVDNSDPISWDEWTTTTEERKQKRSDGEMREFKVKVIKKVGVCATFGELFDSLENDMRGKGCRHLYTIQHQYKVLRSMKCGLDANAIVLHIDFAENYNCKLSSEVQSYHFGASRNQVTIHNVVAYTSMGTFSFSTLSDSMRHDPYAIWCYLQPVLEHVLEAHASVDTIRFISDSPATQYRCKTNFYLFCTRLYDICCGRVKAVSWDYMEAGHGKGAPDGLGAVLKRTADRLVGSGHDMSNANIVFNSLKAAQSGIQLFFVTDQDVSRNDGIVPSTQLQPVKGTMTIKQLHSTSYGVMKHRMLSCYCVSDSYSMCNCFKWTTVDFSYIQSPPKLTGKRLKDRLVNYITFQS